MIRRTANTVHHNKLVFLLSLLILIAAVPPLAEAENWPAWRGPRGDGTSVENNIPVEWSNARNVVWKTPLPGKGHASPIVWEDRVFLVTTNSLNEKTDASPAVSNGQIFMRTWNNLYCIAASEK
ncbi:MAG: PQQ-binding-like beta-propeller repeat protein [Sedimentisphaerales bacterium]|nr:PQQ-binding-like beta-propeller repeat protein [Sedimentisphaerales bacterium]